MYDDISNAMLIDQHCFGYLEFHMLTHVLRIFLFSWKNVIGIVMSIALNLQIVLDSATISIILMLPISEHGLPFHFLVYSLISFTSVFKPYLLKFFTFMIKFIQGIL